MFEHIYLKSSKLLYAHNVNHEKIFIFPITGLIIEDTLSVGKVTFYNKESFDTNLVKFDIGPFLKSKFLSKVTTLAVVNTNGLNEKWYEEIRILETSNVDSDMLSIAIKLLRQSIGILYLVIYLTSKRVDDEKRIVISPLGEHEIEEGIIFYCTEANAYNKTSTSERLKIKGSEITTEKLDSLLKIIDGYYTSDFELDIKKLNSLELLYCIQNEIYARERILKMCALISHIFLIDRKDNLNRTNLFNFVIQLFNYYGIDIYSKLPTDLINVERLQLKKKHKYLEDIYENLRNSFMHGYFDLYGDFTPTVIEDLLTLKITTYELLNLLITNDDISKISTSSGLIEYIKEIQVSKKVVDSN